MTDKNRKSKQFITNWPSSHAPKYASNESTRTASIHEETLDHVSTNELQQGELYILKIKLIAIALFQGWDDDMCCFSVLRTDLLEDLKWSEARYLPENFDAYLAFDYAGNPPIHLWTKQLRAVIPLNWFNIFEEARYMQRQWHMSYWDPNTTTDIVDQQPHYSALTDNQPTIEEITEDNQDSKEKESIEDERRSDTAEEKQMVETHTVPDPSSSASAASLATNSKKDSLLLAEAPINHYAPSPILPTPAMRLQNQYKLEVTQQQQQPKQTAIPREHAKKKNDQQQQQKKKPEMNQRRSFSSFFLKKKTKKSLNGEDQKRSSAPPTPLLDTTSYQLKPIEKQPSVTSDSNEENSSSSSPVLKTPKNDVDHSTKKIELMDIDSYFDMQATFAFLSSSNTDNFSLLDNASSINNTKTVTTL